jgi:hypothetical protein
MSKGIPKFPLDVWPSKGIPKIPLDVWPEGPLKRSLNDIVERHM